MPIEMHTLVEEIGWLLRTINCQSLLLCKYQQAYPSRTVLIAKRLRFLAGNGPFLSLILVTSPNIDKTHTTHQSTQMPYFWQLQHSKPYYKTCITGDLQTEICRTRGSARECPKNQVNMDETAWLGSHAFLTGRILEDSGQYIPNVENLVLKLHRRISKWLNGLTPLCPVGRKCVA